VGETLTSIDREYRYYKALAERAIAQLTNEELAYEAAPESNSVVVIVWHMAGNLKSRFSDFLQSDGEKPWRDRDSEFDPRTVSRDELLRTWNEGWDVLFAALSRLSEQDLERVVRIRNEEHTVIRALHRSVAHASYHVGQIVFIAKLLRGGNWKNLSIPKRASRT
jgi:uncharacterized damage-inducible protein DinB